MVKRAVRNKKSADETERRIKGKFLEERVERINSKPLVPMNERQAEYIKAINNNDLIIATGYAGTSKTFIPSTMAADAFMKGTISKIFLCRPNVSSSQSLGYFSGDANEKLMNWLQPIISVMRARMGGVAFDLALKEKNIELIPLETIKGSSFGKEAWVLVDEAEDLTIEELKSVTTRAGGAKLILSGDTAQAVHKGNSGLALFKDMVDRSPKLREHVAHICFDEYSHIVRSALCKNLIIEFDKAGY
jgi:phosphate starvation-inducible PhoH-like protein